MIVRTASEGMEEDDFTDDLGFLLKLWKNIKGKEKADLCPAVYIRI